MKARRRQMLVAMIAVATALTLTGCGQAPWDAGASASSTPTATVVPTPVPNDLSSGSTERELVAGAVTASVNYWSTLSMDQWTAGAVKPVSLSLITTVTPNDGKKVYLQKATMTAVPSSTAGVLDALPSQIDDATVTPGYLVLKPNSYSQTFNVGPVPEETSYVTLQFTFEFLVQSTPTSKQYAKQTATDTVTVAIAG